MTRSATEALGVAVDRHAVQRVPRPVRRRGWLAPGDPPAPPGIDLLDYGGVASRAEAVHTNRREGVTLGAVIDPSDGAACGLYRLPVERFFQHVAVVAPPGQGKTYGVVAPLVVRLLRAGVSVVAMDVTGSLLGKIREFARDTSTGLRVPFFHWSTDPSRGVHGWNPLAGLDPDDLTSIEGLKASILGNVPADPRHQFFHDRELRILGVLLRLLAAESGNPTLADVIGLAINRPYLAQRLSDPRHASMVYEVHDFLSAEADRASEYVSSLQTKLAPFMAPQVRPFVERSDFDLGAVLATPTLLVAGAELDLRQRGEIAGALMVNRLTAELARRYDRPHGAPVVIVLDEAPVLARRIDLAALLSTARATRAGVVVAAQNVTQFGDAEARSQVFDACDTMILLPGASEASRALFQSRLGNREVPRQSWTRELGASRGSVSMGRESVPVVGDRELVAPPFGCRPAFVHARGDGIGPVALELDRLTVAAFAS